MLLGIQNLIIFEIIFECKKGDELFAIQNVAIPSHGNVEVSLPLHNIIIKPNYIILIVYNYIIVKQII